MSYLVEPLTALWFFALGACAGSFLNVIVYRLPQGKTVLGSSQCPRCKAKIRFRDNVPVLGWFALGGRCRICRLPISARYPVVEATVGMIFMACAVLDIGAAGYLLPGGPFSRYFGFSMNLFDPQWQLVLRFVTHAALLTALLAVALWELDRVRVPVVFAAGCGVLLAVLEQWTASTVESPTFRTVTLPPGVWQLVLVLVGAVLSVVLSSENRLAGVPQNRQPATVGMILAALAFDMPSITTVALGAMVILLLASTRWRARPLGPAMSVFLAASIHLVGWRWIYLVFYGA